MNNETVEPKETIEELIQEELSKLDFLSPSEIDIIKEKLKRIIDNE